MKFGKASVAQSHVIPFEGLTMSAANATETLHLVGDRSALVMMSLDGSPQNPMLEGMLNGTSLGAVVLKPPIELPKTESIGQKFATDLHSATIPAAWVKPGLQLRAKADNFAPSAPQAVKVGAGSAFTVRTLPFYLFGATEANTFPLSVTANPPADASREMKAKWPVASLNASNHPAGAVYFPSVVVGPRNGSDNIVYPAYVVSNGNEQKDGYAVMSAVLRILNQMMAANGESSTATQYYGPLLMLGSDGKYYGPGGGLGGGNNGVGDYRYEGIYIHEQGHAFGLPHAGEAFGKGLYPYAGGSLSGSAWGFDADNNEFLAPFLPQSSNVFSSCATSTSRQRDAQGRCVKQDPMQGGSGDQSTENKYKYTMFADFNTGFMQRYFEGTASNDPKTGARTYSGGKLERDTSFPGGYKRWDSVDRKWVNFTPVTTNNGQNGLNAGLPIQYGVPVHAVAISFSNAGTAAANYIYLPISYKGNLLEYVDPTNAAQLGTIGPGKRNPWFCINSGCDYTVRVTYADGSVNHTLLQSGFRAFNKPTEAVTAKSKDPLSGDSFKTWVINVPGAKAIAKIELLDTPQAWNGVSASPTVLVSRSFP
jgi:hypothetical protein